MAKQTISANGFADAAAKLLIGVTERTVVVGPVTWRPSDGTTAKVEYFIVAKKGRDGFHCDMVTVEHKDDRARMLAAFALTRPPLVIHDTDDELYMARLCEQLWPGKKVTELREAVERERADS